MSKAKNLVRTTQEGEVTGFKVREFQYTTLGKIILNRLLNNRDVKMLVTSSGNTTGTGKSQLAIILSKIITKYCREIFDKSYEWDAIDNSFIDVYEYLQMYKNSESGEVLLTDEMEYMADKRRSMSHSNVHFSQAWQMLRYQNCVTIGTAPSMSNLDIRVPENTDIWINIIFPGYANVYYVSMDDFTGEIQFKRLKQMGFQEVIRWKPIDDDPDYKKLSQKKKDIGIPGIDDNDTEKFDEEDIEQGKKKTEKQLTQEYTVRLLKMKRDNKLNLTQEEIANLVDRSQQYVSKVKRESDEFE